MAFNILDTLRAVQSHLLDSGHFGSNVEVGEPKQAPGAPLSASVFMMDASVAETTLADTIETHTVQIRIYKNMLAEPKENLELEVAKVTSQVMADLCGEFDLGGSIRNIDAGGQYGTRLGARWGYLDVGGTMYRVADITVPLIVDGSATFAA